MKLPPDMVIRDVLVLMRKWHRGERPSLPFNLADLLPPRPHRSAEPEQAP